ncbi:hypothetical protein BDZ89DRAFT_149185 [Hymenopellis radicata]|nr:hypothetical protein BDZ89DRAFT_149185 [Hymenopellis radicata]
MPAAANPLFLKWVKAFHAEKDYKKRGGPPRATGYENAIRALQSCSTKYDHPKDLKDLTGIGPTCISRLIDKLEEHCAKKGIPMPEPKTKPRAPRKKPAPKPKKTEDDNEGEVEVDEKPAPKKRALRRDRPNANAKTQTTTRIMKPKS